MITLTNADIGRAVAYQDRPDAALEKGVVTSFDRFFVFVRYGTDRHSKATKASYLEWVTLGASPRP